MNIERIWQLEDEITSVVDATIGNHVWRYDYDEPSNEITLTLDIHLDDDVVETLVSQFYLPASYIGESESGSEFVLYPHD